MKKYALLFEAESIQVYITDTGRLADAVGASSRLDQLCGDLISGNTDSGSDLLSSVLGVVGAVPTFSRRGGGSFTAFFDDVTARDRVQSLWTLALHQYMPGLRFSVAAAESESELDAAEIAREVLRQKRNQPSSQLPEPGPLTRRTERTGRAAVLSTRFGPSAEYFDAKGSVYVNRDQTIGTHDRITALFSTDQSWEWPRNLETEFPHLEKNNTEIAVVHADGNGLGIALQSLSRLCATRKERYVDVYSGFSRAVTLATRAAARHATEQVLAPAMDAERTGPYAGWVPARPLVLGGDDLSIIVRPDLAVPFAEHFMLEFERATQREFEHLRASVPDLPPKLTAAAGIAVVHAKHPFDRALHLAESLCAQAKKATKVSGGLSPSSLMFYRQTTALLDDWADIEDTESSEGLNGLRQINLMGPYLVGEQSPGLQHVHLHQLRNLSRALAQPQVSRGALRHLLTELRQTPHTALQSWSRFRAVLNERAPQAWRAIEVALNELGLPAGGSKLPFVGVPQRHDLERSALGDAMTLAHCESAGKAGS